MAGLYKLICIDLDGTLLGAGSVISDYNVNAIRKAVAEGAIVCIASGRGYGQIIQYHKKIGLNTPVVAFNGAYVYDPVKDEYWRKFDLPVEETLKYLRFCDENDINWSMVAHYSTYSPNEMPNMFGSHSFNDLYHQLGIEAPPRLIAAGEEERIAALEAGIGKITFRTTPEEMALVEEYYETPRPGIVCKKAGFTLMETMHEHASKWDAIKDIAAKYDIPDEQIVVFGDNMNDLEMIQHCPTSFAMSNGDPYIFPYATHLAEPNTEDGVGKAIEKYILGNIIA